MDDFFRARRAFLRTSVLALFGFQAIPLAGCSPSKPSCVDPELLSTPERALRARQGYVDVSPHGEEQRCGGCQFFSATDDGCGRCRILDGPVARTGHCRAWAAATTEPT